MSETAAAQGARSAGKLRSFLPAPLPPPPPRGRLTASGTPADGRRASRRSFESAIVLVISADRATIVLQAGVALGTGALSTSSNAALAVATAVVALAWAVGLGLWQWRRRTVTGERSGRVVVVDALLSAAVLLAMLVTVVPDERHTSWLAWAYSFSLSSAALFALVVEALPLVMGVAVGFSAVYLAVVAVPVLSTPTGAGTAAANSVAYPGFALVAWVLARTMRRLADDADTSRELAARLAAQLEQTRSRRELHNVLPFLALDEAAKAGPDHVAQLAADARRKLVALRRLVDGAVEPGDVRTLLEEAVQPYSALALTTVVTVEPGTALRDDVAVALRQAVESALANVQQNAPEASVALTAHLVDEAVEVSVVDDGQGFDPSSVRASFGIRELLGAQLAEVGGRAEVVSRPGLGTRVLVVVPAVRA